MDVSEPFSQITCSKPSSPDEPVSDAALAALVAQGDREAAGAMVQRHQSAIHSFLCKLTGREDVAADLTQETLLRMLRNASRYDCRYSMPTWLLTIARRIAINHAQKKNPTAFASDAPEPTAPRSDPAQHAAEKDHRAKLREQLDRTLKQLTEQQRCAIVLFHQQGLSLEQVAQVMDLPAGTVKSHLHRGRAKMREILQEEIPSLQED